MTKNYSDVDRKNIIILEDELANAISTFFSGVSKGHEEMSRVANIIFNWLIDNSSVHDIPEQFISDIYVDSDADFANYLNYLGFSQKDIENELNKTYSLDLSEARENTDKPIDPESKHLQEVFLKEAKRIIDSYSYHVTYGNWMTGGVKSIKQPAKYSDKNRTSRRYKFEFNNQPRSYVEPIYNRLVSLLDDFYTSIEPFVTIKLGVARCPYISILLHEFSQTVDIDLSEAKKKRKKETNMSIYPVLGVGGPLFKNDKQETSEIEGDNNIEASDANAGAESSGEALAEGHTVNISSTDLPRILYFCDDDLQGVTIKEIIYCKQFVREIIKKYPQFKNSTFDLRPTNWFEINNVRYKYQDGELVNIDPDLETISLDLSEAYNYKKSNWYRTTGRSRIGDAWFKALDDYDLISDSIPFSDIYPDCDVLYEFNYSDDAPFNPEPLYIIPFEAECKFMDDLAYRLKNNMISDNEAVTTIKEFIDQFEKDNYFAKTSLIDLSENFVERSKFSDYALDYLKQYAYERYKTDDISKLAKILRGNYDDYEDYLYETVADDFEETGDTLLDTFNDIRSESFRLLDYYDACPLNFADERKVVKYLVDYLNLNSEVKHVYWPAAFVAVLQKHISDFDIDAIENSDPDYPLLDKLKSYVNWIKNGDNTTSIDLTENFKVLRTNLSIDQLERRCRDIWEDEYFGEEITDVYIEEDPANRAVKIKIVYDYVSDPPQCKTMWKTKTKKLKSDSIDLAYLKGDIDLNDWVNEVYSTDIIKLDLSEGKK